MPARNHQHIEVLRQRLVAKHVRRHARTVRALNGRGRCLRFSSGSYFVRDEQNLERIWRWTLIAGADKTRDRKRFSKTPHIDWLESFIDQDANANSRGKLICRGH